MFITDKKQLREYYSDKRIWQGIPGIERTKGGRLFATWYSGGTKEEPGNYQLLVKSDDDGKTWSEPIAVAVPHEGARCFDGCLWIDPLQRLWFCYTENDTVMAAVCDNPDEEELSWHEPEVIGDGVMLNKPVVLSTGEWLFPVAVWVKTYRMLWTSGRKFEEGSYAYKTSDNGKTFTALGKADVPNRSFDEHMILEHNDGSLSMYVRTNYGIGVSRSYDGGRTWSEGSDSGLGGPCSRFYIRRLKSGRILLINHFNFTGRNNLMLMLSEDDGKTFSHKLMLDERSGVSYPDATQSDDGFIYVITDFQRGGFKNTLDKVLREERAINISKVTEEDIMLGYLKNPNSYLLRTVNKLNREETVRINPFCEAKYYSDGDYLKYLSGLENDKIVKSVFDNYGVYCANMKNVDSTALDTLLDKLSENKNREETLKSLIELVRYAAYTEGNENPVVNRVVSYISENMCEDTEISVIAKEIGVSKYYMCHAFKEKMGITIISYRNSVRLANAKRLLITTEDGISSIAGKCGFADSSYFSKIFKAEENMTPSEYRKLHSY